MTGQAAGLVLAVLLGGVPMLNASSQPMRATLEATPRAGALQQRLTIREYGGSESVPVRYYDRDMTKKLHLIVVDDRLQTFMHVHPALQPGGALTLTLTLPHTGIWHLYADGIPHNFGRQVFRFDLPIGQPPPVKLSSPRSRAVYGELVEPSKHEPSKHSIAPYAVALDRTTLQAGKLTMVHVHITKRGKPAGDLLPYLGARAHVVVIGTDLSYIHAHAMAASMAATGAMSGMANMPKPAKAAQPAVIPSDDPCGQDADVGMSMVELPPNFHVAADMMVMLQPAKPGTYFLWLQFRGGGRVYTAPFMLHAV